MRLLLIFLMTAICAAAQAQTIFRSVMPDGRIVFGDKPAPGAKESKPMTVSPTNVSTPGPTSSSGPSARQQALDNATNEMLAAQQNLDRARAALESGREPLPEERVGMKGGGMRTTEAYDQRIKALEQDVQAAQKQLSDAQTKRNDAR
jgi:multidrug efflux pump subunit AcrA (membrane-fusion protein)